MLSDILGKARKAAQEDVFWGFSSDLTRISADNREYAIPGFSAVWSREVKSGVSVKILVRDYVFAALLTMLADESARNFGMQASSEYKDWVVLENVPGRYVCIKVFVPAKGTLERTLRLRKMRKRSV